jgi:hypothetical protein
MALPTGSPPHSKRRAKYGEFALYICTLSPGRGLANLSGERVSSQQCICQPTCSQLMANSPIKRSVVCNNCRLTVDDDRTSDMDTTLLIQSHDRRTIDFSSRLLCSNESGLSPRNLRHSATRLRRVVRRSIVNRLRQ